jgi:energy-coupling factor transporter ATP-binding protein EcfA2
MTKANEDLSTARFAAFGAPIELDIFQAVAHAPEIWRDDPYDVIDIHSEAREVFETLARRAAAGPREGSGRILLLKGESGSGKTHLLRAFRQFIHSNELGHFGYLQMTTGISDYFQYVLRHLIHSLEQPHGGVPSGTSALMRLSNRLAENPVVPQDALEQLRNSEDYLGPLFDIRDLLLRDPKFSAFDSDFILVLLALQRRDPLVTNRVIKYLRCEFLTERDRQWLGGIASKSGADDPPEVARWLCMLPDAVREGAIILCIDQLEDVFEPGEEAEVRFRRAMQAVRLLTDKVPSLVVVIACLEDYYARLFKSLDQAMIDRIEKDPEPVRLVALRSLPEIEQLVARRLAHLFESAEIPTNEEDPLFPFTREDLGKIANRRTRDVLTACRLARSRSIESQELPRIELAAGTELQSTPIEIIPLEQKWNDFFTGFTGGAPENDTAAAALLTWAIEKCGDELPTAHRFAARTRNTMIEADVQTGNGNGGPHLLIGICNKRAQGGGLGMQVDEIANMAGQSKRVPVLVRSSEFPGRAGTQIAKKIGELIAKGGSRSVISDGDWRAIQAFQSFFQKHATESSLLAWRKQERPLTRLQSLRGILSLDNLPTIPRFIDIPGSPQPTKPKDSPKDPSTITLHVTPVQSSGIILGQSRELRPVDVIVEPSELTRHAAILGGSGSGKTTLALSLIEQLLLRGTPAILLDRKGDLCAYASDSAWTQPLGDPAREGLRAQLREQIDVQLYTPGQVSGGCPLAISLLPRGASALPPQERLFVARGAAAAIGAMMNYRSAGADARRIAALAASINTLAELEEEIALTRLIDFIASEDPSLLSALGHLDPKLLHGLVQDLETFRYNNGHLLAETGAPLDTEALLGLGTHAKKGKTRLSIISTKFLGDTNSALFWIAQLLLEITRYASRNPSDRLQAVVLADEADLYLPAVGKPPTKEPMENALRRFRSAGIGLLLATQSPGDFDYKCRDNIRNWFVGRVKETTALNKMKPMLAESKIDLTQKLPGQSAGQFYVLRDGASVSLQAFRSLIETRQLPDDEILRAAEANSGREALRV